MSSNQTTTTNNYFFRIFGKCVAEMEVAEEHTNKGGTLHGGLTATLVDTISTVALMTTGPGNPGVSVDINVT